MFLFECARGSRMSFAPLWKGLPKRLRRDDVFPFKALGSLKVFLRLIAATREIDLIPSIRTATIELGLMSSKNLCQAFLRMVEGVDGGILGKSSRGRGE